MPLDMTTDDPYDTPSTTPDPYAPSSATTTSTLPPHIDLSALPSGFPILGSLFGYTPAARAARLQSHLTARAKAAGRPLTESEQTALVHHSAKAVATASWGTPIGLAAGVYRTYATRADFRWPIYGKLIADAPVEGQPQTGFWDGQKMRAGGKEILQGVSTQAKANILHTARGFAYCLIGSYLAPLLVSTYAATVNGVREMRDPRLQELNQAVRANILKVLRERQGQETKQTDVRRGGGMPGTTVDRDKSSSRRGAGPAEVDDASPTGGAGVMMDMGINDEHERIGEAGDMMDGVLSDGQMRTAEAKAQPRPNRSPTGNRAPTYQMDKVERQPKDFDSDFPDASPAGGSGVMDDNNDDGSGGSVWERIRQQSVSEPSGSSNPRGRWGGRGGVRGEQQEGATLGDGFSFSGSDEERSFAKDEAQRDFDERIERERSGGDFSSDGGKRRW